MSLFHRENKAILWKTNMLIYQLLEDHFEAIHDFFNCENRYIVEDPNFHWVAPFLLC